MSIKQIKKVKRVEDNTKGLEPYDFHKSTHTKKKLRQQQGGRFHLTIKENKAYLRHH